MRRWMLTSLATGLCALGFGASVQASDTMRLDGKGEDAETLETRGYHGGYHGGGYHGHYHGGGWGRGYYGGGWGRSYYGGGWGRGYYGGYGRGFYGLGYGRGYYGGGYYGGGYYGGGYSSYYSAPVYYYSSPSYVVPSYYYSPCASAPAATIDLGVASAPVNNDVTVLRPSQNVTPQTAVPQPVTPQPRTFQYDGGSPRIPLPREVAPMSNPKSSTVPFEGKLVSLPGKASSNSYTFRAYGENMLTPATTAQDTHLVSDMVAARDTFRLSMPLQTTGGSTSLR